MFTGIIREVGIVASVRKGRPWRISIKSTRLIREISVGDSISVSGICLTAVDICGTFFTAQVSGETLRRTALADLRRGEYVNLEPALAMNGRLDGHIVQGHVDDVAKVTGIKGTGDQEWRIRPGKHPGPLIVEKGSVAVDGVSLTIAACHENGDFSVALIPLTIASTNFKHHRIGSSVNLEYDILGKYVAQNLKIC